MQLGPRTSSDVYAFRNNTKYTFKYKLITENEQENEENKGANSIHYTQTKLKPLSPALALPRDQALASKATRKREKRRGEV